VNKVQAFTSLNPALYRIGNRFVAIGALLCWLAVNATAQSPAGGGSQSNQIGPNAFVASPAGEVYLIFNAQLFHNEKDNGNSWVRVAYNIKAVALDPHNEKVIYGIDLQNHVVKSLDAGKQWLTLNTGFQNVPLFTIYVNPTDSQEVLVGAANGLFKTTDAGFSWHPTSFLLAVNQIVLDPRSASNRYLLSAGSIFTSSDSGNSWKKSEAGLPTDLVRGAGRTATKVTARVSLLVFVNLEKPALLAATFGKGVMKSDDGGASWKPVGTGLDPSETFITATVGKQRVVLASSDHLYRSTDGSSWTKIAVKSGRNIPGSYLGVIEYPKREGLLVHFRFSQDGELENMGQQKRVGYLDARDVLIGLNYGVLLHSEVDNVWASTLNGKPSLFAVAANSSYLDQVQSKFSYLSTDNGYSWELIGKTECGASVTRPRGSPSEMWVYGNTNCVVRSRDGGLDWEPVPGVNFQFAGGAMTTFQFDTTTHDIAYYSVGVNERHLFRYQYSPETRQGQSVDLKTIAVQVLVDESNHSDLFTDTARLSTDGGWTWTDKSKQLAKACKCDIGTRYLGPAKLLSFRGGEIHALIDYDGNAFNGYPGDIALVRSRDLGETWDVIAKLDAHKLLAGPFINPDDAMNVFIGALTAPKGTPGAFGASYRPDAVLVLETKDGGATWKEIYRRAVSGQFRGQGLIRGITQLNRAGGRSILMATSEGLLRSEDEGRTWSPLGGIH
jgi:photosystem II stability/assembly factor-like uncharacterized protein